MDDLISRKAAIEALSDGALVNYQAAGHNNGLVKAIDVIKGLPSTQPTQTNMPNTLKALDCVSRQAAISNIKNGFHWETVNGIMAQAVLKQVIHDIEIMPSAQPVEVTPHRNYKYLSDYWCECGNHLGKKGTATFCSDCGRKVNRMRAIDADVLIEKIRKLPNAGIRWFVSAEAVFDAILNAPTIEPQQKKGRWILVKGSNGKDYHKCSECLHTQDITGVKNYCAVCGANMRGEQNEP